MGSAIFWQSLLLVPPTLVERGQSSGPREVAFRSQDPDRYRGKRDVSAEDIVYKQVSPPKI